MNTTCDICKIGTDDLGFDDVHEAMNAPSWMYAFMCKECRAINNAHWNLSFVSMKANMEISMMKRTINRYRRELNNG